MLKRIGILLLIVGFFMGGSVNAVEIQSRIIDPDHHGWPRQVEALNGIVTIESKPQRIHTLSLGYDEITLYLVGVERMAAIATFATNPNYSNIAELAEKIPNKIKRDAEQILAAEPDLVVASPYAKADLIALLEEAGVTVVQSDLVNSVEGHAGNIGFLAYLYGEEERGEALIREVEERLARIREVVEDIPMSQRPRVLRISGRNSVPGEGTNWDGIIRAAGGINAAAEAGLERYQKISLESIVTMNPDVIIVNKVDTLNPDLKNEILSHPALQDLPVIKNERIYGVKASRFNTLSHWNVRGVETLAKILHPDAFDGMTFDDFTY